MTDMIERVARALHALPSERWSEVRWDELQTQERDRLLREARAAIEAMREPHVPAFVQDINNVIWNRKIDDALRH